MPSKKSQPSKPGPERKAAETATGKYVYDKKLKRVVKVSDDIPGLRKSGGGSGRGHCCPGGSCCGSGACDLEG